MDSTPLPNSFYSSGEHCTGIGELNKKRKLPQYEWGNSGLPWPKQKIRDRSGSSDHGRPSIPEWLDKENSMEEPIDGVICDGLEVESENDSTSFIRGSDNKMTTEGFSTKPFLQEIPSTSSNSSTSNLSKYTHYSLESRSMKKVDGGPHADIEEECAEFDSSTDQLEHGKKDSELEDETTDDMMLYSNDVSPFLLASVRWSVGQDARLGTRKPTIDQEFEQYFSGLML